MGNINSPSRYIINMIVTTMVIWWKKAKRLFKKQKEGGDPFLKTVKICSPRLAKFKEFKVKLDTGCEAHNLITIQALSELRMLDEVQALDEVICICLNGQEMRSSGTVILQWKGKGFRKIFNTHFHLVEEEVLPWEVILGGKMIHEHSILRFGGFGARCILPKMSNEEQANLFKRKQEHAKTVAANEAMMAKDMKEREDIESQYKRKSSTSAASNTTDPLSSSI